MITSPRPLLGPLPIRKPPTDMTLLHRLIPSLEPCGNTGFPPWKKVRPEWLPYTVNSRTISRQPHEIAREMLGLKNFLILAPILPSSRVQNMLFSNSNIFT